MRVLGAATVLALALVAVTVAQAEPHESEWRAAEAIAARIHDSDDERRRAAERFAQMLFRARETALVSPAFSDMGAAMLARVEAERAAGVTDADMLTGEALEALAQTLGPGAAVHVYEADAARAAFDRRACESRATASRPGDVTWIELRRLCSEAVCTPEVYFGSDGPPRGRVVLDLRGNQGGPVEQIGCVVSGFTARHAFLFTLRSRHDSTAIYNWNGDGDWRGELVALIDEHTNVGGLMIAAALQDQAHARIAGRATAEIIDTVRVLIPFDSQYAFRDARTYFVLAPTARLFRSDGQPLSEEFHVDIPLETNDANAITRAVFAN